MEDANLCLGGCGEDSRCIDGECQLVGEEPESGEAAEESLVNEPCFGICRNGARCIDNKCTMAAEEPENGDPSNWCGFGGCPWGKVCINRSCKLAPQLD